MDLAKVEELTMAAAQRPVVKTLDSLLNELRSAGKSLDQESADKLEILWESWNADNLNPVTANFCLELAALSIPASAAFRAMLAGAVKTLLPPYLSSTPFLRALGLRDDSTPVNDVLKRFRKLEVLKNGTIIFRGGAWGIAGAPDSMTAALPVSPYGGRGSSAAVPMESILKEAVFLSPGLEMNRLTDPAKAAALSSSDFRAMVRKRAITNVSDTQLKAMAMASAGKKFASPDDFEKWWSEERPTVKPGLTGNRRACDGRSLMEMELLLDKETAAKAGRFSADEVAALTEFFTSLKPEVAAREAALLARVMAKLLARIGTPEEIKQILSPLKEKTLFWPQDPAHAPLAKFSVWGEIPAKNIDALADVTVRLWEPEYLAECALRLPLKALNSVCTAIPDEVLFETLQTVSCCGSDLLLWMWKNRRKLDAQLMTLVNIENVVRALSQEKLPKEWGPAQRELRLCLLEKDDFHKQMIASANDAMSIAATLQGALFLSPGERQSLLVKLSRQSESLRDYIENGAGQRILNAGLTAADQKVEVPSGNEPSYTSIKSHQRLLKELDDIINTLIPENREALKIARAHGDFRENAEFDAAKERRNFLSHRRSELERELTIIQPVPFRNQVVGDEAIIGSQVDLADDEGEISTYYLLGAWDGDPDKNYLSYRTRLGQAIYGHKKGAKITMPNGSERTIADVKPLSEAILLEME